MKNTYIFDGSQYTLETKDGKYIITKKLDVHSWAERLYLERIKRDVTKGKCKFIYNKKQTICVDCRTLKAACSRCLAEDEYNITIGSAIAYCRLYNIDMPKEVVNSPQKEAEQELRDKLYTIFLAICMETVEEDKCPFNYICDQEHLAECDELIVFDDIKSPKRYSIPELKKLCSKVIDCPVTPARYQNLIKDSGIFTF